MGKQPFVTTVLLFLGGILLAESFLYFPLSTALFALLFLGLAFRFKKDGIFDLSPFAMLIIGGIGFWLPQTTSLFTRAEDLRVYTDDDPIRVIARVASAPQHYPDRVRLRMEAVRLVADGESRPLREARPLRGFFRVTLRTPETSLEYGDLVEMTLALRRFEQFENPGVFPVADYLERQGLAGGATLANERQIKLIHPGENRPLRWIYRYRDAIRRTMIGPGDIGLTGPIGPILLAMTIGESGFLTDAIRDPFTASGTNHILSISGSHLAMIAFIVFGLSRFCLLRLPPLLLLRLSLFKIPSQWAAAITAPVVIFYALLSGMAVATQRSLIMILAYLLAVWTGRSNGVKIALSLAALLIVMVQPAALFDISFQLSFLAVLFMALFMEWYDSDASRQTTLDGGTGTPGGGSGLLATGPGWRKHAHWRERLFESSRLCLLTSLGATLGTAPLTLYYFHQFSWAGLVANLVLIPFVGFIVLPLGLALAVVAPAFATFPLASLYASIGSFYFALTQAFAQLPGADFHFASPSLPLIFLFYVILPILLVKGASRQCVGLATAAFFAIFLGWGALRIPPKNLQVTFLDVGQGDAALIEFPEGEVMLVDAGLGAPRDRGREAIAPFLWEKKIKTLDYIVGTHPQADHMGGFPFLIEAFNVKNILTNGTDVSLPFYRAFLKAAEKRGIAPRGVTRADPPISISGCRILFLNPRGQPEGADLNNRSVVFRLSCSGVALLFTGDIEKEAMAAILRDGETLQSDLLKVPHHGSKTGLYPKFLERVAPRIAIFSAGRRNRYGHPHPYVVASYARRGALIYRTDWDGAVTAALHQTGFALDGFSAKRLQTVRLDRGWMKAEWANIQNRF